MEYLQVVGPFTSVVHFCTLTERIMYVIWYIPAYLYIVRSVSLAVVPHPQNVCYIIRTEETICKQNVTDVP